MGSTAFFAYPSSNGAVRDAIDRAVELSTREDLSLRPWESMRILGFKIDDLIRDHIDEVDLLVADITFPNHNVLYEIGYAVGVGKPVLPTLNTSLERAVQRVQEIGLFDTMGWLPYDNGDMLSSGLRSWNDVGWKNLYDKKRDQSQPLFILDCLKKTDFRNQLFHSVGNSQVEYRTYDPEQVPRLTAAEAIRQVSASAGMILPFLTEEIVDSQRHNLRAAFLLGLAHGYGIDPLAIQYEHNPVPLDYRDFVTNSTFRRETEQHVESYCQDTLIQNQRADLRERRIPPGVIGQISMGASFAENETQTLARYFVETAEFSRALRAEGAVVIGRKGSGKSAVFQQIAEARSRDRTVCIVDLRPASHNLSELREELLGVVQAGIFDHTIAAFWQYIMYVEILLKIREMALPKAKNDFSLQERIRAIEERFSFTESIVAGDFTSRLEAAVREVVAIIGSMTDRSEIRSKITNVMFEQPIPQLRDAVVSFQDLYTEIVVLIDDLDKGWPPRRVEEHDVAMIKHLIEVLNRIHRDLGRRKIDLRHVVFLRSDIYERLVELTSDRGKYNVVKVDWSDPEQLQHLLKMRVTSDLDADRHEDAWAALNPHFDGTDATTVMIEHSLRRPRFLIDLCERVLSFAINRGHVQVNEDDLYAGIREMSLYLVSDFGYELRDVAGTPESIFYKFIGAPAQLTAQELEKLLDGTDMGLPVEDTVDLLVWYGFLGIMVGDKPVFIYDRAYDFRRLEAERPVDDSVIFAVNPAFIVGLTNQ
jgi:hypothetical protein